MKTLSIIPARSGSKGVPNKNIKELNGKPLIFYSIETSISSNKISKTIVTTDSEYYKDIILSTYKNVDVIMRPEYLSNDTAKDIHYILHVIYNISIDIKDIIVLLRPTTPIRDVNEVNKAIEKFTLNEYDSLRSIHKINEPPEKMVKLKDNFELEPYMGNSIASANLPRQNFDDCYLPNGYVDILSVKNIINTHSVYGERVFGFKTEKVIEIDSEEDFKLLELMYENSNGSL